MRAISDVILPCVEGHYVCIMASLKHFRGPFSTSLREKNRKFFRRFLTKPLAVNNTIVFQGSPQQNSSTVYSNSNLLVLSSPWALSPAGRNIQDWCEKFLYQTPQTGEEIISCFSSGCLDSLKDQMKTWHHHPCLASSPYQGGVTSDSSSVGKGASHMVASWKPQLWGKSTYSFPT